MNEMTQDKISLKQKQDLPETMFLYLVRHGETDWNAGGRLQGRTNIPLNEKGRDLARRSASGLSAIPFDCVISSPLIRARETAELMIGERNIPIIEDDRIIEISFGDGEGSKIGKKTDLKPGDLFYEFFFQPDRYIPLKNGETIAELKLRTGNFLSELRKRKDLEGKHILISTHGAALRALLSNVKDVPVSEFWQGGVPRNCSVSALELHDHTWRVVEEDVIYYEP